MMASGIKVLETKRLNTGYKTMGLPKIISGNIEIEARSGELICLLGPNGAGKSTLIKTLAGIHPAISGNIELTGVDLQSLEPLEVAKKLSLVLTDRVESGHLAVRDLVALGRAPYTGWLGRLTAKDYEKIAWAIHVTGMDKHRDHKIGELSDGERQNVFIARALAQDTPLIILDEPTAHLDSPSKIGIFRLLRSLSREEGKSILVSSHELDLALQAADKIWLMDSDGKMTIGGPEELVINGSFETVFQKDGIGFDKGTGSFRFHKLGSESVELIGGGYLAFWTRRALERKGFRISDGGESMGRIEILPDEEGQGRWVSKIGTVTRRHHSIEDTVGALVELKQPSTSRPN